MGWIPDGRDSTKHLELSVHLLVHQPDKRQKQKNLKQGKDIFLKTL
jgi:hypothetical protein